MSKRQKNTLRTIKFKTGYWSHEDDEERGCIFHVSGLTSDEKTVQLQIGGFTPFVYLELPKKIKWNVKKCKAVFTYFQGIMKANGPIKYKMYSKDKLLYKKTINTMFMSFPSWKACKDFGMKCMRMRSSYIPGVGTIYGGDFIVHEQNIDAIIKYTAAKKILLADWIEAKETIPPGEESLTEDERKFSTADIDFYADFTQVKQCHDESSIVNPTYCSFDGEMYSKNHNAKLSDPKIKENTLFQLSMVFGRLNTPEREKILLTLFDPLDIEGTKIIRCKTEKELILKFTSLIKEKDPDLFIGYNIIKYDWNYIITRAEKLGVYHKFMELSRIIGRKAELKKNSWSSSAYGDQEFRYPECHGRIHMDVLLEVERNYRMPAYNLNAVSEKFLGEKKDPVTARHMFMMYQMTEELLPLVNNKDLTIRKLRVIKKKIQEIFLPRFFKNAADIIKDYRKRLLSSTVENIEDNVREAMTIIGKYCVKDSMLPVDLIEKLNLYTTMEQMSNVMHVPMSYLHTRGQQIKVLAQVYRETISNNIIIPHKNKKDSDDSEGYQGAVVIEANPGDYGKVGMLDFASLYPTVIIAYNICYTTILEEGDPLPDSECHILMWESHVGCSHDTQKRKKKNEDILCGSYRYRFRKVKIEYNEETGEITRKYEGLMPKLERNLLASRKVAKNEMFKIEARLKMQRGQTTEKDISYYKTKGWEIIEKGSLGSRQELMLDVWYNILNAKQLAIKVSANSVDEDTPIPCLIDGKFKYVPIKELFGKEYTIDEKKNEVSEGPKNILVWSDGGWSEIKYVFRHKTSNILRRIITKNGCVDVTDDHSLLTENKEESKASKLKEGDTLLHIGSPLPEDVPENPKYPNITEEQAINHELDSSEERKACKEGLFFAEYINTNKTHEIPDYLLNAEYKTRLSFFCGYCSQISQEKTFTIKNKLESAKFFWLIRSLGYNISILNISDEEEYSFHISGISPGNEDNKINSIRHILRFIPGGIIQGNVHHHYVYDIETSTHHFAAGVGNMIVHNSAYGAMGAKTGFIPFIPGAASVTAMGRWLITEAIEYIRRKWKNAKLVYGDTDSCLFKFLGCNLEESFDLCEEASKKTTHYLKSCIMKLEEDYVVTTLTGKKYTLDKISLENEDFKNLSYKDKLIVIEYRSIPIDLEFESMYGRLLLLTKKRYVGYIVNKKGETIGVVKKGVVLARRDNSGYLRSVYKKLTDSVLDKKTEEEVMEILYEEIHKLFTRKVPDIQLIIYMGVKNVINYAKKKEDKNGNVYYLDSNKEIIENPIGPLDPRLDYPNLPQCLLSQKMMRRGTDIPPNTRLEFLYLENPDATHQGHKAEDYTYYVENKEKSGFKPDYLHYLEKQLSKPVTELLSVKYPREPVIYEKLDDSLNRMMSSSGISDLKKQKISRVTSHEKPVNFYKHEKLVIGWNVFDKDYEFEKIDRVYKFKNKEAKVEFILNSSKKKGMNEFNPGNVYDAELIDICKKWKSRNILDKLYKKYGMKKRPTKCPTQRGEKLRKNTKIIFVNSFKEYSKGVHGKVIDFRESNDKRYYYSILIDERNEKIVNDVPRRMIATYYLRDSTVMKDILNNRVSYKNVVDHLKEMFDPFIIEE